MNRIESLVGRREEETAPCFDPAFLIEDSVQERSPRLLFTPLHYERNYAYPLLVWLHSDGDDQRQLERIMPHVSVRNYVAVGPRAPVERPGGCGFEWTQSDDDVVLAENAIFDCIEHAQERFNIAPHRVFLGGYRCGGSLAFRVGLSHPDRFAGIISIGGSFPTGHQVLARLDEARRVPILIADGQFASEHPVDQICDELRLLHAAGFSITLRQYPCGDELDTLMLRDMNAWMMELVTGAASVPQRVEPPLLASWN